jgi:hypothetical protein
LFRLAASAPALSTPVLAQSGTHYAAIVTAIFAGIAALGASFAAFQVVEAKRARIAVSANELAEKWDGPEVVASRKAVDGFRSIEDLGIGVLNEWVTQSDAYYLLVREPNFYENLAILAQSDRSLVTRKSMQFNLIKRFLGSNVVGRFKVWQLSIYMMRIKLDPQNARPNEGAAYSEFEWLATRMASELQMEIPDVEEMQERAATVVNEHRFPPRNQI